MRLLLDTHLLLWAAGAPERLSPETVDLLSNPANDLLFSAASIWEVAIKSALGRSDFRVDARALRRSLADNGYQELPVTGLHSVNIDLLPAHHKDPFDRMLVSQALCEGMVLLTGDGQLAAYGGPVRLV